MQAEVRRLLAEQIKPARVAAGMSQLELAELAGVHRKSIGYLEAGTNVPQDATILKIADVLGINTIKSCTCGAGASQDNPHLDAIAGVFSRLNTDDAELLGQALAAMAMDRLTRQPEGQSSLF